MIRPMQATDVPDIIALLNWMDDAPEREVFAPDARSAEELQLECEGTTCMVQLSDDGVVAFCALSPFYDGLLLEGPLCDQGAETQALLQQMLKRAQSSPIYAFCARDNAQIRGELEHAGFTPMHGTDFYTKPISAVTRWAICPEGFQIQTALPQETYLQLYRVAEDAWSGRLDWTKEQYKAHFAREDTRLVALARGNEQPVGFAELEFYPEEGRADITYLAVHPAERGQHLGRTLLALAAAEAETQPEIRTLRVRAHDHMHVAKALYAQMGFEHCRAVVTYFIDVDIKDKLDIELGEPIDS